LSRQFFKNVGWLAAAETLSRLKGLVVIPLITAYFGTLDYGVWAQVAVLVGLVPPLIILGTDSAVARFLPGEDEEQQKRHFFAWGIAFGATALFACSLLLLIERPVAQLFFGQPERYEHFIPLAAASIFTTAGLSIVRSWFRIRGQAKPISAITLLQSAIGLGAIVYVLVAKQGVYELVLWSFVGDAVLGVAFAALIVKRHGWARPDFSILPRLLRFGLPLMPAGYAVWALNWLDRIFLIEYSTLRQIGIYSLAYTLGYLVIQVAISPIFYMFPNTAADYWNSGDRERIQGLFERSAGMIVLVVLPTLVGSAVLGGGLLHIMATPDFASGAPVIPIIMGGYACTMVSAYYESMLGMIHKQYLSTVGAILAFLVNLGLNFLLIPPYGIVGAGIATATAFAAQLIFSFTAATRYGLLVTRLGFPLKVAVASLAMGAAVYGLSTLLDQNRPLQFLALVAAGVAVYAAIVFAWNLIPRDLVGRELRRLLVRRRADAAAT
jgi:O-antigen/teichoic acid export membrane protein